MRPSRKERRDKHKRQGRMSWGTRKSVNFLLGCYNAWRDATTGYYGIGPHIYGSIGRWFVTKALRSAVAKRPASPPVPFPSFTINALEKLRDGFRDPLALRPGPTIVLKDGITPEDVEKLRATVQDAVRDGRIVTVQIAPHEDTWPKHAREGVARSIADRIIDEKIGVDRGRAWTGRPEDIMEDIAKLKQSIYRSTPVSVMSRRGKSIFGGGIMGNLVARLFPSFQAILDRKKGGRA